MKNEEIETIGSKPSGMSGLFAGKIMNMIHSSAYRKIIHNHILKKCIGSDEKTVLDIGCGGGVSVKIFSEIKAIKKAVGVDYSDDMVELSKKYNKRKIHSGSVEIRKADVSELPFDDDKFDIISAFDTINFWPDYQKAISEIIRTLKTDGVFFIINAYPKEGTKWYDFVKFKSDSEYRDFLINNGLKNVESVIEKNTVIVWGQK